MNMNWKGGIAERRVAYSLTRYSYFTADMEIAFCVYFLCAVVCIWGVAVGGGGAFDAVGLWVVFPCHLEGGSVVCFA